MHSTEEKAEGVFSLYPLNSVVILSFLAKIMVSYVYIAAFTFFQQRERSEDVVSYYSMLQTGQDTQKTVCCSAAFHHYGGAYTWPFHDITLQLSQNQRYCTNIEKAHKSVVTQTVAFHTIVKLHFISTTDIVPYCATQWGQGQYYTIGLNHSSTKIMSKTDDFHIS